MPELKAGGFQRCVEPQAVKLVLLPAVRRCAVPFQVLDDEEQARPSLGRRQGQTSQTTPLPSALPHARQKR